MTRTNAACAPADIDLDHDHDSAAPKSSSYLLFVLFLANIAVYLIRYLLVYLYPAGGDDPHTSIAAALDISDAHYASLVGLILYAPQVAGTIAGGYLASLGLAVPLLVSAMLMLSLAPLVYVFVGQSFVLLQIAEGVLGWAKGVSCIVIPVLIGEVVPREELATADGMTQAGLYLGTGLAIGTGGCALAIGWRLTCIIAAVFGLGVTALCATLRGGEGDARGGGGGGEKAPPATALWLLVTNPAFSFLVLGYSLINGATVALWCWVFVVYDKDFQDQYATLVWIAAAGLCTLSVASAAGGGLLADWLLARGFPAPYLAVILGGTGLMAAAAALAVDGGSAPAALAGLLLFYACGSLYMGPYVTQTRVALDPRALAAGISVLYAVSQLLSGAAVLQVVYMHDAGLSGASLRGRLLSSVLADLAAAAACVVLGRALADPACPCGRGGGGAGAAPLKAELLEPEDSDRSGPGGRAPAPGAPGGAGAPRPVVDHTKADVV